MLGIKWKHLGSGNLHESLHHQIRPMLKSEMSTVKGAINQTLQERGAINQTLQEEPWMKVAQHESFQRSKILPASHKQLCQSIYFFSAILSFKGEQNHPKQKGMSIDGHGQPMMASK